MGLGEVVDERIVETVHEDELHRHEGAEGRQTDHGEPQVAGYRWRNFPAGRVDSADALCHDGDALCDLH